MDITLVITLIILVLLVLFILGLIAPAKFTAWGGSNPHRGKAFFYLIVAFILLLVLGNMADDVLIKEIEETPEKVTKIELIDEGLSAFPDYLSRLINLETLDLSENKIKEIDESIKGHKSLIRLYLAKNPIASLPDWLADMPSLRNLNVYGTDIDSSSLTVINKLIANGVEVNFDKTFITGKGNEEEERQEIQESEEDEHAESFTEFAKRRLLEGRGAGHRRKYGKGEIFYNGDMDHAMLDSLGAVLTEIGLFSAEKEVSVELIKNEEVYQLLVVTIYEDKEAITEDVELSWHWIRIMIKSRVFPENELELHLCDQRMKVLKEIKSDE